MPYCTVFNTVVQYHTIPYNTVPHSLCSWSPPEHAGFASITNIALFLLTHAHSDTDIRAWVAERQRDLERDGVWQEGGPPPVVM